MPIRLTGMNSGLDTESIISELVKAKSAKKDKLVKAQTKLDWKQEAWKDLNKKVYSFYSKTLSNMRFSTDFMKKTTKASNPNAVSVLTNNNAVNGVQSLKVNKLAKTGYLTGAELRNADGTKGSFTGASKLSDLDPALAGTGEINLTVNGKTKTISIDENTTIDQFTSKLQSAGVNASFDSKNQRLFISAKESGTSADFSLTAGNAVGNAALAALGLNAKVDTASLEYKNYDKMRKSLYDEDGNKITDEAQLKDIFKNLAQSELDSTLQSSIERYNAINKELKEQEDKLSETKVKYASGDDIYTKTAAELKEEYNTFAKDVPVKGEDESDDDFAARKEQYDKELAAKKELVDDKAILDNEEALLKEKTELEGKLNIQAGDLDSEGNITSTTLNTSVEDDIIQKYRDRAEYADTQATQIENGATGSDVDPKNMPTKISGQDAEITLNGAIFTSTNNIFEINGLTITANAETAEEITLTTTADTDGIYDMVKNFFKEYNELINEMDKLYNIEAAKGYEPLTDEEKDAMSDKEVEKWEEKIKGAILRRDSTLGNVSSAMKQVMLAGVTMGDGSKLYLSDFGINTMGYFNAAEFEKNAYHIDGDKDDSNSAANEDKLKNLITTDPDKVVNFFTTLSQNLYGKLGDMMKGSQYSSAFTLYDDKSMKDEYKDYTSKIADQEKRVTDFEDRYYKKFSKMETAMAKMQSKQNALAGMFGGGM